MFERVLTATNMLGACDAAVIAALDIAKRDKGRLSVLHVLEPSYFHECGPLETVKNFKTGEETAASQEYKEVVKDELDQKCGGVLKPYGNYEINIAYGRPSVEIRRWARKFGADIIVLGPHEEKIEEGFRGTLIGNTVEDVIMHAASPVIIVNRLIPKERFNFKKIMTCVDFSKSCEYAVEFSIKLAKKYDSSLHFFHMLYKPQSEESVAGTVRTASKKKLLEFCKIPGDIHHEYVLSQGIKPSSEILKYSLEKQIDLIVMGSHTTVEDRRWYIGSVVDEVSEQCLCPVAVVTHPDIFSKI